MSLVIKDFISCKERLDLMGEVECVNWAVGWSYPPLVNKITAILERPESLAFFAWTKKNDNTEIMSGYVVANYKVNDLNEKISLHVHFLAVHPDYGRLGVGTKLMKLIFKAANQNSLVVTLKYSASYELYQFYGKFKPTCVDSSNILDFSDFVKPIFDSKVSLLAIKEDYKPNITNYDPIVKIVYISLTIYAIFKYMIN